MINAWKVIWIENNKKFIRSDGFEGDSPKASGVIDFAKKIAARGVLVSNIHVVSKKKAFAPPPLKHGQVIERGSLWCPYCLKYRDFREFAIKRSDFISPAAWRCPICTISINDYYVRLYNAFMVSKLNPEITRSTTTKKPHRVVR